MIQSSFWKKGTQLHLKRGPGDCIPSELLLYSAPLKSESIILRSCKGLYGHSKMRVTKRKSHRESLMACSRM